jgi:hypothetical protein
VKLHLEGDVLPLLAEVKKVTAEETENLYKQLRKHGISKKTAQNTVKFYEG